jgi:DNA-binding NtrC family response regulator
LSKCIVASILPNFFEFVARLAVEAMQLAVFNYLQKPLDLKQLRSITERAAESSKLCRINRDERRQIADGNREPPTVSADAGKWSDRMQNLQSQAICAKINVDVSIWRTNP